MLISFSEPPMLPYIRAGLRQRRGEDIAGVRVKRQTMRKLGERGRKLLEWDPIGHSIPYDLHLWWKSRTTERELIGEVRVQDGGIRVYALNILHSEIINPDGSRYPVCRIDGPRGWRAGDAMLFWSPGDEPNAFCAETFADGFDSPAAFRDYFVPNLGDRFDAILFKW
ncbi:hypothetical protein J4G48_0031905 [Bradyrhizobium barranii subsp. apii]|uniref:hypothetical protein n=1 Tax=Bradyrhizobium barranii TaxID=2992140 RepID=UPI001AA195FF|nr:hypothetical protein [Bradyrhizobium barranii]UPT93916.1 hypothetical protein J4G48_0031905 [Bradyrhizobium barranii subsp. apii]